MCPQKSEEHHYIIIGINYMPLQEVKNTEVKIFIFKEKYVAGNENKCYEG